jgi:polyphosphate glucokinase
LAGKAKRKSAATRKAEPQRPWTLAIDIGGTGLKAALLDAKGALIGERVRVDTEYPLPPDKLIRTLIQLVAPLESFDRVSVGFPGVVRKGHVLSAPHFVTVSGPGSAHDPKLERKWDRFDLAGELEKAVGKPVRCANDADLQGAAVIVGSGLELVVTLGTGVGTALYMDGKLAPHLELAHHPFRKGETYNEQLGEAAREKIGSKRWNKRVEKMIHTLRALTFCDRLFIGGGNSRHVKVDLGPNGTLIDNVAGLTGGIKLWTMLNP